MSEIKVNKLSPRSGTTVTIGDSGDTISIPSGVTLDASSGGLAGTLTTAAQPNITSVGTLTSFTSTGIDDNADATAITIDSSERVGIGTTSPSVKLHILGTENDADTQAIRLMENSTQGGFIKYDGNANELQLGGFNSGENTGIRIARNDATTMFNTNGAERVRIDDSGNVGIGNTVASTINSANGTGNLVVGSGSGTEGITIYSGTTGEGTLQFADGTSGSATYIGQINYNHSSNDMSFTSGGTERMRLLGTGSVGIGTTSPSTSYRLSAIGTTSGAVVGAFIETTSTNSSHEASIIKRPNNGVLVQFLGSGQVGSITTDGSSTTYATSSDYRLKENVVDLTNATERLKQLQPKRFNFISDADKIVDGFLAHEVSSVVPEAIHGTHNEVEVWKEGEELPEGVSVGDNKLDGEGNTIPVYQGIDQSKLVPLLVKTIQELEDRITALEANNL